MCVVNNIIIGSVHFASPEHCDSESACTLKLRQRNGTKPSFMRLLTLVVFQPVKMSALRKASFLGKVKSAEVKSKHCTFTVNVKQHRDVFKYI